MNNLERTEKTIAICDSDLSYAGRLVEYLRREAAFPCEIRLYTGAEKLLEDPDVKGASLVVISQSQYDGAVAGAGAAPGAFVADGRVNAVAASR